MRRLKSTSANCKASTRTQYNTNAQNGTLSKGNENKYSDSQKTVI